MLDICKTGRSSKHTTSRNIRKSDKAYRKIKIAILNGKLAPGISLDEQDLMKKFCVGRTPLRESLQRLTSDGLVTTIPRGGIFVSLITAEDVHAVYELRCNLDSFAAKLAATRASEDEIKKMVNWLETSKSFNKDESVIFDDVLHGMILHASHNKKLEKILRRLYLFSIRLFSIRGYKRETLEKMQNELRDVVKAISDRDPERASKAALRHIVSHNWFIEDTD